MTDWQMLAVVLIGFVAFAAVGALIGYEHGRAAGFDAGSERGERWGHIDGRRDLMHAIQDAAKEAEAQGRMTAKDRLHLSETLLEASRTLTFGKEKP